jgi:uncharacterized membrane protein YgdD (TMEM256/DUF423 family)
MLLNKFAALGCLSAAIGVGAGAFGAHGLKSALAPEMLVVYETAVRYQMYHAFALIITGLLFRPSNSKSTIAGWCFAIGTALFSGSLYLMSLSGIRWLGAITPLGGVAFIAGWLTLAVSQFDRVRE